MRRFFRFLSQFLGDVINFLDVFFGVLFEVGLKRVRLLLLRCDVSFTLFQLRWNNNKVIWLLEEIVDHQQYEVDHQHQQQHQQV